MCFKMYAMLVVLLSFSSLISMQTGYEDVISTPITPQDYDYATEETTENIQTTASPTTESPTTASPITESPTTAPTVHPRPLKPTTSLDADEYYNQFCVDDETGRYYRRGESWHLSQDCIKVMCKFDVYFQLKKFYVGCGDIHPVPPCERVEGMKMGIFPECCPMVSCPSSVKQLA